MSEVLEFVQSPNGIAFVAALLALGGTIVKLTPTKTDDKWWRALMGVVSKIPAFGGLAPK